MKNGEPTSYGAHYTVRKVLTDDELVRQFESSALSAFPHAEHVRLTIIYLRRHGRDETEKDLRRTAAVCGGERSPRKFHVTMTIVLGSSSSKTRHVPFPGARTARP